MDPNLKYSETIECNESNPLESLINKPAKKPVMVFKKSRVLERVSQLLERLKEETIPEPNSLNIENCKEDEPYIKMSAVGFMKESENETEPKLVILPEVGDLSEEDCSEDESEEQRALIEDISEQALSKDAGDSTSIERTVEEVSSVVNELMEVVSTTCCEAMVH